MSHKYAAIGIDWGTHSSKWTWTISSPGSKNTTPSYFKILNSAVQLNSSNDRISLSAELQSGGVVLETGLKGILIRDPEGSFWDGPRKRSKMTLGELVSFSLWHLMSEAYQNIVSSIEIEPHAVEFRLSLPNWVGIDNAAEARGAYEQAARVACEIFIEDRFAWSRDHNPTKIRWQETIKQTTKALNISDDSETFAARNDFAALLQHTFRVREDISFRFVAESSAAGLMGLREVELEEQKYLRKILVVDVGAGSTDIGYVLRTIPPTRDANEALIQLPPANTCRFAGEELTRSIVEIHRNAGKHLTFEEAEQIKLVEQEGEWINHPAAKQWRDNIGKHVESYVADIPDGHWLPDNPPLQVLVTGGSGLVAGLAETIVNAAKAGLARKGVRQSIVDVTSLMDLNLQGPAAVDANRLAVSLGAASNDLPRLNYYPQLDPPMTHPTVKVKKGWTG